MSPSINESWSRHTWTCIGNSDEDSKYEQEDSAEAPGTMPDLKSTNVPLDPPAAPRILGLEFERYHKDHKDIAEVTDKVFKLMKKPLKRCKDPTRGYIYALSIENYPGYVKIGYTGDSISSRLEAIEKCVSYKLRRYDDNDYYRIPHYQRLEKLIHAELRNERRKFDCRCVKKATANDCSRIHGEWFAISQTEASVVINRWRRWISTDPYTGGTLRPSEQLKIDYYNGCKDFRWSDFVEFPRWKLQYLWLYNELHRPRPEKLNCSRWDSLCKYWKSNLLFYATTFMLSQTLSVILNRLPSTSIYIGCFILANKTIWGIWGGFALLYAA